MIDLANCDPWVWKYIKKRGLACVYVIAYAGGRPSKVGYATNISKRFCSIQSSNAQALFVEFMLWFPDAMSAAMVEHRVHLDLDAMHLRGEWFDIHAELAAIAVRDAAARTNTLGDRLVEHSDLLVQLRDAGVTMKKGDTRRRLIAS